MKKWKLISFIILIKSFNKIYKFSSKLTKISVKDNLFRFFILYLKDTLINFSARKIEGGVAVSGSDQETPPSHPESDHDINISGEDISPGSVSE